MTIGNTATRCRPNGHPICKPAALTARIAWIVVVVVVLVAIWLLARFMRWM